MPRSRTSKAGCYANAGPGRPELDPADRMVRRSLSLPPDVDRELAALAEISGRKVSAVAADAIRDYCKVKLGRRRADLTPPRARPGRARRSMPE